MSAWVAWRDALRRVASAPAILASVWLMTILVGLPLALALRGNIVNQLGGSLVAGTAARGADYEWMQEFAEQATGLGRTLRPTLIGFGAVLDNLGSFLDNAAPPVAIASAAAVYIVLWLFVAGGIIDRYARDRPTDLYGFVSASGGFFFRFVRLGVVMLAVYAALFAYLQPWLLDGLYPSLTREVTVERTAFFIRVGCYLVFGVVLAACNLVFDYAKIRAVVEDRRSALGALASGARFIRRHGAAATTIYLMNVLLLVLTLAAYALVAPRGGGARWTVWIAFAIGQCYLLARLAVKLIVWASETALFQSRLAHAGYVASSRPVWSDRRPPAANH